MVEKTNLEGSISSLHENYLFKEFTYSNNTFRNAQGQEVELADNVIYLDGLAVIFQLKERNSKGSTNQEDEGKWFKKKVLGKAKEQVKDTLAYLSQNNQITLKNQQGDDFTLSKSSITQIHKIIVYSASENLSDEYKYKKFHINETAGVVHIFSINVYREIIEILMTPAEISEYLLFRENLIQKWKGFIDSLPEGALIGQYFSEEYDKQPSRDFTEYILSIDHKIEDWDVTGIIHSFRKRLTQLNQSTDYYFIIQEIAKLRRSELKLFLERYKLARENAYSGEYKLPYRFAVPRLNCGFIFIPWLKEDKSKSLNVLNRYTAVHKYEQKLSKCVGVIFIEDDKESDEKKGWTIVEWCFLEHPWKFNAELEKILKDTPLREVSRREINRYEFSS